MNERHDERAMRSVAVECADVSVVVDGETLLSRTSVVVERGEVLALTGANGAGKTTLLRVVAGTMSPSAGRATVEGLPPSERDVRFRTRVASLVGRPALSHDLTLAEQLAIVGLTWGIAPADTRAFAADALRRFDIEALARRFPHELSSGQTQLLALAIVFARPASLVLLDEPEQRLDDARLELLGDRIAERAATGDTIVMASHRRGLIERVADRELRLEGGGERRPPASGPTGTSTAGSVGPGPTDA